MVPRIDTHKKLSIEVARLLKKERENRNLSKAKVSETSGLSRRMIGFVEEGKRNPTLDTLSRLTEALGIELAVLIRDARQAANQNEI